MSKKITQGEGWKVISANPEIEKKEVISKLPEQQKIKIAVEKRKKGKIVTILSNLVLSDEDLNVLTKSLKNACGTGGTVNENNIELQGDIQQKVKDWLIINKWGIHNLKK